MHDTLGDDINATQLVKFTQSLEMRRLKNSLLFHGKADTTIQTIGLRSSHLPAICPVPHSFTNLNAFPCISSIAFVGPEHCERITSSTPLLCAAGLGRGSSRRWRRSRLSCLARSAQSAIRCCRQPRRGHNTNPLNLSESPPARPPPSSLSKMGPLHFAALDFCSQVNTRLAGRLLRRCVPLSVLRMPSRPA